MFCPYCGVQIPAGAPACRQCGRAPATAFGTGAAATVEQRPPARAADTPTVLSNDAESGGMTVAAQLPEGFVAPQATPGAGPEFGPGLPRVGSSAPALGVGTAFGNRYHIIRLLGMGGMGAVYQAWDDALGVAVALKVIRPEITADPAAARDLERRFKRELLLARQVTHKHVVRIHDLGEIDGIKYLTMPYIQGSDLASILSRERTLPVARAIAIARQVASGLQAAHDAGVVHRDLKPANVMIDADDHAVIMDFGIARSVSGPGATMAGAVVGTLEYMAPEQAMAQPVDHRADIYALGLMLYDMVLGPRQASRAESAVAELMARVQKPLPPARTVDPSIPEALERVIDRCTQPDPAARYQTTEQLVHDLELIDPASKTAGTRPLAAPPITRPQEPIAAPAPARVVPLRALLAVAGVLLGAAAGGWLLWSRTPGESGAPAAAVKPVALAVLPFRNATGDAELDSLGPTFAHLIRDAIGDSARLRLVSPDRVSRLLRDLRLGPNTEIDVATIRRVGEFTSADSVVTGRFARIDDQFRFDATVHPAAGGEPVVLAASAAGESGLLRAAQELGQKIRSSFAPADEAAAVAFRPSSESLTALRAYDEGLERARFGEHLEAVKRFEAATRADPQFALAFAQLGQTMANLRLTSDAEAAAKRALALSANLPREEREVISAIHARITNDMPTAIAAYERLVQARPMDVQLRFELAGLLDASGDLERARDEYARVLEADPKFPDALFAAGRNAILRADYKGSLEWFTRAQVLAVQLENQEAQARVLHALGVAYKNLGRLDEALKQYEASLDIKRRIGDTGGIAQSLNELAQVHDLQGRSQEAMASYKQAIEAYRQIGNRVGLGLALNNLGAYYLDRGQYDEALAVLKEALPIQRELGDTDREALCLQNIGSTFAARGDYLDAITYLERALELRERSNVPSSVAEVLASLGEVSVLLGDYDRAQREYLRAIELSRGAGDSRGEALGSMGMGVLHGLQGRLAASLGTHADALKIVRELGDQSYVLVQALAGFGAALSAAGQFDEAARQLDEAAAVAKELRSGTLQAQTLNRLGDNAFYRGDLSGARTFYHQALQVARRGSSRYDALRAALNVAKVSGGAGRAAALRKLVQEADALGLKYTSAEGSLYLGQALLESRNADGARVELESALSKAGRLDARILAARAHHLLAETLGSGDATGHADRARQIVEALRAELNDDAILARADLRPLVERP